MDAHGDNVLTKLVAHGDNVLTKLVAHGDNVLTKLDDTVLLLPILCAMKSMLIVQ